eukprot:scaffold26021_cov114-Isochrysis_galbana.AAC.1
MPRGEQISGLLHRPMAGDDMCKSCSLAVVIAARHRDVSEALRLAVETASKLINGKLILWPICLHLASTSAERQRGPERMEPPRKVSAPPPRYK